MLENLNLFQVSVENLCQKLHRNYIFGLFHEMLQNVGRNIWFSKFNFNFGFTRRQTWSSHRGPIICRISFVHPSKVWMIDALPQLSIEKFTRYEEWRTYFHKTLIISDLFSCVSLGNSSPKVIGSKSSYKED